MSFKASHPITLADEVVEKALGGIRIGILPADHTPHAQGIKPTPLFSAHEIAFLVPAITRALRQAESDHRVRFEVEQEGERTDGTLYIDGPAMRFTLHHYRSSAQHRDENQSIYALSFKPELAQLPVSEPQWAKTEPGQPQLAIAYGALAKMPVPADAPPPTAPASTLGQTTGSPAHAPGETLEAMKGVVDKQAQELQSLKAELEALKKQLHEPVPPSKPRPARKPSASQSVTP
jgi:hypothetical protein